MWENSVVPDEDQIAQASDASVTTGSGGVDVELLRRTFDGLSYLTGVLGLDGRIIGGNQLPFEVVGVSPESQVGRLFIDGPWWQHDAAVRERVGGFVAEAVAGRSSRTETTYWTLQGVRHADLQVAPLLGDDGRPTHVLISAVDITDRVRQEAALHGARRRLEVISEAGITGAWEWEPDSGVVECDATLRRMWGLPTEDPVDLRRFRSLIQPEDLVAWDAMNQRLISQPADQQYEFRIRWPDGQVRWLAGRCAAVRGSDDRVGALIGINWDVTDQRQETDRMRVANAQRQLALEAASMGLWDIDPVARTVIWDSRGGDAFASEPDVPMDMDGEIAKVHPDERPDLIRKLDAALDPAGDGTYDHIYRTLPTDGKRWFRAVGQAFFDGQGDARRAVRLVGGIIEVTREIEHEQMLRRAQHAAEAASRAKGEFLANMSHEIRTPMTAIMGFADILAARLSDGDNLTAVHTIRRNARFLVDILNDILDLSKIEAGKLQLDEQRFDPVAVLIDVRSLMEVRSSEKDLSFELRAEGPLPRTIRGDAKRFRQILINLVGNAVKFTQSGGISLVARVDVEEQRLSVEVIDTGVGISAAVLDTLFQPFIQGDGSLIREHGGSGLGLEISRRMARMLGGDVTVTSTPDVGSHFVFTLATGPLEGVPLAAAEFGPRLNSGDPAERVDVRLDGRRVLIADDRGEVRALVRYLLEDAGAIVEDARDGQTALDRLTADPGFDAMVLDMQMPIMDGYRVARAARQRGLDLPIIALTAHAMVDDEARCLRAGCNAYATKPIDSQNLLQIVHQLIDAATSPPPASPAADSPVPNDSSVAQAPRVLMVEDDEGIAYLMTRMLEPKGFTVRTAADGAEALARFRESVPDVVLLDLGLPDMDGTELYRQLIEVLAEDDASLAVIALTGRMDARTHQAVRAAGIEHLMVKPPDFDELADLIRDLARPPLPPPLPPPPPPPAPPRPPRSLTVLGPTASPRRLTLAPAESSLPLAPLPHAQPPPLENRRPIHRPRPNRRSETQSQRTLHRRPDPPAHPRHPRP